MLSTGLTTAGVILLTLFAIFVAAMLLWTLQLARYCHSAVEIMRSENKRAVSLRRIAELDATLTELSDAYAALLKSNRKLRARIGMRAAREAQKTTEADTTGPVPVDEVEKARYKSQLRKQLQKEGRLP